MGSRSLPGLFVVLAALAVPSLASPDAASSPATQVDRAHAIAARMSRGESYDQAAREALPAAASTLHAQEVAARMSAGLAYDQAAREALPLAGLTKHAQEVAARMSSGTSYDQAARAVQEAEAER